MNFQILKEFMDHLTQWKIPGNTVIVNHKGKEVFKYSSGYSDLKSGKRMQGNEMFNVYSCSKPVTVTAALQLYERGAFFLDDPISEYLPAFSEMYVKDEKGNIRRANAPITFRHLFTMSAGLTYNLESDAIKLLKKEKPDADTVTVAKYIAKDPLQFEPGSRYAYSLCHDVLAALVEIVSGMSFGEYVKQNIFAPMGFENDVAYKRTAKIYEKMASQYCFEEVADSSTVSSPSGQALWREISKDSMFVLTANHESGGAGMAITADAYAAFAHALANLGRCQNGERLLASGTVNLMRTSQGLPNARAHFDTMARQRGYDYGLGVRTLVDIASSGSNGALGEFGWDGAGGCYTVIDPTNDMSLFYAQHIMYGGVSDYIQTRLRNITYRCIEG